MRVLALLVGLFWASSAPAVGITGFLQFAAPGSRPGVGFALGLPLFTEVITLEGEYSRAFETEDVPSLTMWSANVVLISPIEFVRLRPYLVTGFGVYRQTGAEASETSFVTLPGFGTFLRLRGPLHGRVEYRVIRLRGEPLQEDQKRFYLGLTLRF